MTNLTTEICKIGTRIECGSYFGTVKYVGEIEGKPALWLGIDWDNPERGKHNGNVNGTQYFTTRHPTSGSFVRPEKVDFGVSIVSSIETRYGQTEDDFTAKINAQKQLMIQQSINAPFLEMIGFDKVFSKQSDFATLKIVNLRNQKVSFVGSAESLAVSCPNIGELDLSRNLLANWTEIFEVCTHLKSLYWINVSENLMAIPEDTTEARFPNITTLICGAMELIWADIVTIAAIFPNVEECICPNNKIQLLDRVDCFRKLKNLDVEGNSIEDWSEICKLDSISSLEQINLENTGLYFVEFGGTGAKISLFKNLKKMCLVNNFIHEWKSINELNRMENLENLKISKNPVFQSESLETAFQLTIARLGNLKVLNGVCISKMERRGAEIDYLKKYGLEWLASKGTDKEEAFLTLHGRFLELIEMYGEPEEAELLVKPKVIQSSLIELELVHDEKVITKRLPPSITVQKLNMLVQRLFKLKERPQLTYICKTDSHIQIDLIEEQKEIGIYSMQNGDQINVKI